MTLQDIGHNTLAEIEHDTCTIYEFQREWRGGRSSWHTAGLLRAIADYIEEHHIAVFDLVYTIGDNTSSVSIYGTEEGHE